MAQPLNLKYENKSYVSPEKYIYSSDSAFHTSIRPFLDSDLREKTSYENYILSQYISRRNSSSDNTSVIEPTAFNLVFNRNFFIVRKKDYGFTIDPLFDFSFGFDAGNNRSCWTNTRGFIIEGSLGRNFAFSTQFYENQARVPLWIDNYVNSRGIIPGQGRVKAFGSNAWDYANASGYISWSPGKFFNFQFGHGKQFLGDGYRSLILSDHSLSHPYMMITTSFWKIKYVNIYSQFSHPDKIDHKASGDPVYSKKYSTMHYLSYVPWKKLNISLFESIMWSSGDSSYTRGFDFSYLNPVIFYRPVEFNLGSGDNALIGLNLRYSPLKWMTFYGQFVFDEFKIKEMTSGDGWNGNKYAWQLGLKTFDFLGVTDLELQAEYNLVRPYMYSHYDQVQNYSNAKESLAHPSGANIKEAVAIAKYNYKRLYLNIKYVWSGFGLDSAGINYGKNIFRNPQDLPNEYGNLTGQGLYTVLNQMDVSVSLLVNPSTNMNLFISYTLRTEQNSIMNNKYSYFGLGFRTSLRNLYNDFF